jgi:hypothetical protein
MKKKLTNVVLLAPLIAVCTLTSCMDNKEKHQQKKIEMKEVLIIGMNPRTIDFTNPELPKGLTVEMIENGTRATLDKLTKLGYAPELFLIDTGTKDLSDLSNQLKQKNYVGVVVGNGIRSINANFILFEQIINVVHISAPNSKIIFNSLPSDTDEAIKRWL